MMFTRSFNHPPPISERLVLKGNTHNVGVILRAVRDVMRCTLHLNFVVAHKSWRHSSGKFKLALLLQRFTGHELTEGLNKVYPAARMWFLFGSYIIIPKQQTKSYNPTITTFHALGSKKAPITDS